MKKVLLLIISCIVLALPSCSKAQSAKMLNNGNYVKNSDFEKVEGDSFADWKNAGNVKPEAASGTWKHLTTTFRSGSNTTVSFFFWVPKGAAGSVWIDNVAAGPGIKLVNPSFEEVGRDGSLAGWHQTDDKGTVFSDTSRASQGNNSVRITHVNEAVPTTQIWQDIAVEPNHNYTLSYDLFIGNDFQGEAKGWLFNAAHTTSIDFDYDNLLGSKLVAARDRSGRFDAVLTPTANAPAELSQEAVVPPNANLQAKLDLDNSAFEGTIKFVVEDAASGRVLHEMDLSKPDAQWQTQKFSFQSDGRRLRIRLSAAGMGELHVDNLAVTPPQIIPAVQQVEWLSATNDFSIPSLFKVSVQGKTGVAMDGALALLQKDLQPHNVKIEKVKANNAPLQINIGAEYSVKGKGDEAYSLNVNNRNIVIKAKTEHGAFYGVMTLLQLIDTHNNKTVFLPCNIVDYPDLPLRGFLYADAEQAARWKLNTLMVSIGYPVTPKEKQHVRDIIQQCKNLNLDFIPLIATISGGYYVEKINPNLAAGIAVNNEKITLRGLDSANLAHPYVIRTKLTDVKLKSADGNTEYVLGKDYQVINGDMKYSYNVPNPKPFSVVRLPGSAIPDGGTVLASYDWVSHDRNGRADNSIAYVPLEPETQKLTADYLRQLVAENDFKYIASSADLQEFFIEDNQLKTDSRVIKSGKTPIELMVEDTHSIDAAIKQGNSKTRLFQWAGDVGEYAKAAGPYLPKDSLINIWGYDANWPAAYGRDAIKYWSKLGFETSVMPWDNLRNIDGWAQVVAEARAKGYNCQGIVGSGWEGRRSGLKETAIVAWKIPENGDKNFVPLPNSGSAASGK